MKHILFLVFPVLFCSFVSSVSAQQTKKKAFDIKNHADLVSALSYIKTASEAAKSDFSDKRYEKVLTTARGQYNQVRASQTALIDKYIVMLNSPGKSRKNNVNVDAEMKRLQDEFNKFMIFYQQQNTASGSVITKELIDLVIGSGKSIYDIIHQIVKANKDKHINEVKDQKLVEWPTTNK